MQPFAMELNDRAVALARAGRVLAQAPSAVFDGSAGTRAGSNAWNVLRARPMSVSTRHLGALLTQRQLSDRNERLVAAELTARLADTPLENGERAWIASPARTEASGLSALLGVARRLSLPIDGFIDAACATVAALGLERQAIVLELGLHHVAATAVDCEAGQARRRRAIQTERGGFIELNQMWLDLIGSTMVKRTRFDPLHDAATEQQLFDALPALLSELAVKASTLAVVSHGTERFEVVLTRDQFSQAADTILRTIVSLLHQLRSAGAPIALVIPHPVAALPGLRDQLEQFCGCELVVVPDGFAAAATSMLELPQVSSTDDPVRLLRRLPLLPLQTQCVLSAEVSRCVLGANPSGGTPPSHILLDGRTYAVGPGCAVVVGRLPAGAGELPPGAPESRQSGPGAFVRRRYITLPEGLAGVSRRHCTFIHDRDGWVLLDHSSFGTFVNGERVAERVRVAAGDRVRLGEPGVELALIAVGDSNAAGSQP